MYEHIIFEKTQSNSTDNKLEKNKIEFYEKFRRRVTDEVKKPDIVFSVNGKIVSTRKNIFAITGKAKAGKSFAVSLILASILQKGNFQGVIESYLPKGKDKVILFDTEQSEFHISVLLNRIKTLGASDSQMENLITYSFDTIKSKLRRAYFEDIIFQTEGVGLVLIDGIADLLSSINNEEASSDLLDDLRAFATKLDIAIGFVLHQNPSESLKMRGHVGTIATNKSESTFEIVSDKKVKTIKLVQFLDTRNAQPDNFAFEINENGIPEIIEYEFENKLSNRSKRQSVVTKKDQLKTYENKIIELCFDSKIESKLTYGTLLDYVKRSYLKLTETTLGDNYAKEFIKECVEVNKIVLLPHEKKYIQGDLLDF